MTDFRDRLPFEPTVEERKDFDIDCSKLPEHLHNIGAVNKTKKHLYDQGTVSGRKLAHMFTNNKYELKEDDKFLQYGNVFIEFNNWNGPSGLQSTKSNTWTHRFGSMGLHMWSVKYLRELLFVDGKPSTKNVLFQIKKELKLKKLIWLASESKTEGNSKGFVVNVSLLLSKEVGRELLRRGIEEDSFNFELPEEWR